MEKDEKRDYFKGLVEIYKFSAALNQLSGKELSVLQKKAIEESCHLAFSAVIDGKIDKKRNQNITARSIFKIALARLDAWTINLASIGSYSIGLSQPS